MTNFAPTPNPSNHHAASLHEGVVEFGLHTFGDLTQDVEDTRVLHYPEVLRNVVAQGVLADQVGIDVIDLGQHHCPHYVLLAPYVFLPDLRATTERIKLICAVTVLSSDDPVRVHQRFATLDGIASGRAEVSLGRGSFIESFPLFGYDLADYEILFEEKLELFDHIRREEPVTWSGTQRAALEDYSIFPKTAHEHGLPTWVAVGGSPKS